MTGILMVKGKPIQLIMLKNYFITAIRNLARNRVFSFINIVGLSAGLAACMLILLYTKDELSFDRFHENGPNLSRITCHILDGHGDRRVGISGMPQAPAYKRTIPGIQAFVRTEERPYVVRKGAETFNEKA